MIFIMKLLQEFLFKREAPKCFLLMRYLGTGLLVSAGGGVLFFLFKLLTPKVGYFESGAIICTIMMSVGFILLYCSRESTQHPPVETVFRKTQEIFKEMEGSLGERSTGQAPWYHSVLASLFAYLAS